MGTSEPDGAVLARCWARGEFHRVTLLAGPDTLTRDEAFDTFRERFLGAEGGLNVDLFDGNEASAGAVLSAAATLPFFGGRRLVALRRADRLTAAEMNRLADGLGSIPPTNALVLLWDERPDQRTVLVQAAKGAGAVAVFWPPFENQLPSWIIERAARQKKRMDRAAAQALLEAVGPSLPDLRQEIGKLVLYVKDRPAIAAEDVAALKGERVSYGFWEWERALWRRDRVRALSILAARRDQGDEPPELLPQVVRAVQKLWTAKALFLELRGEREVFERLRIKSLDVQRDLKAAGSLWTWEALMEAIDALAEVDLAQKTGRGDPAAELTRLIFALTEERPAVTHPSRE